MPVSTTMTIRVSPELKKKLDRIASGHFAQAAPSSRAKPWLPMWTGA